MQLCSNYLKEVEAKEVLASPTLSAFKKGQISALSAPCTTKQSLLLVTKAKA